MLVAVLRRLLLAIPLLAIASLAVFVTVDTFPGDPCLEKLGPRANEESLAACREDLNLDGPFLARYLKFLGGALRVDFGHDIRTDESVGRVLLQKIPPTVELALVALLLAGALGTFLGTRAALRPGSSVDLLAQLVGLLGVSIPVFWLGMMLIALLGVTLGWLPFGGWSGVDIAGGDFEFRSRFYLLESLFRLEGEATLRALHRLALPALTLCTVPLASITRMTRSAVLEELSKDYVQTARAKGLPESRVIGRHVRRNAMVPVVTLMGLQLGMLLSGAVLTETVFSWPGLGTHLVRAAAYRNHPVLLATILFFVVVFIFVNLAVDLLYHAIDPRMRALKR